MIAQGRLVEVDVAQAMVLDHGQLLVLALAEVRVEGAWVFVPIADVR